MRILGTTIKTSTILVLLLLAIAAYHIFATLLFLRVAIPTVATVQGFRNQSAVVNIESRYGSRRTTYVTNYPIIKYRTATGNEYELSRLTPCDFLEVFKEGQSIDILYDSNNPGNSCQNSIGGKWGASILFLFLSVVILFYRLSMIIKKHRVQHRRREGR